DPSGEAWSRSPLRYLVPIAVAAAAVIVFLPALDAGFLSWDDEANLVTNESYRGLRWSQLRWMWTTTLLGHYVPVTWLSFGVNFALGGMDPRGYHLGNILLHAANAVLFYFVGRRLLAAAMGGGLAATAPAG